MRRGFSTLVIALSIGCALRTDGVGMEHPHLVAQTLDRSAPDPARPAVDETEIESDSSGRSGRESDDAASAPRIPRDEGPFYPSLARLAEPAPDIARLANSAECVPCHSEAVRQHRSSAHARSSFDNPWYRATVDRLRADRGFAASRHCAGCHDPLLLFSGAIDSEIDPRDEELAPLASAGITCLVCHGIVETSTDGNGSYVLSSAPVPIPDPNSAEQVAAHRARLAPAPLRTPGLCGSCHRAFLGPQMGSAHHLPGLDELGPWRGSVWGEQDAQRLDSVEPTPSQARCRGCHMPEIPVSGVELGAPDGFLASHRFAGGHSALAAQLEDPIQMGFIVAQQSSAATLDLTALVDDDTHERHLPADGASLRAGESITFDVVIRNTRTGHFFPGGAKDLRDHWVSIRVLDGNGRQVAHAGLDQAEREDPSAFKLRTAMLDSEGDIETHHFVHRFAARGWDHTIAPRDARAARYRWRVPGHLALPVRIEARLQARRHHRGIRELGCEASRSARGRAFAASLRNQDIPVIDGCAAEPIIELASASLEIGDSHDRIPNTRPSWQRSYEHALALLHDVQERLDDARFIIEAGLTALPQDEPDYEFHRNQFLLLLGRLEASQGRHREALELCDRIESSIGPHPAIDRVRGDATARVWQWGRAAEAYESVVRAAPLDTEAHRDLARALGSLARDASARNAAIRGLALLPRDEALLRTQALALEHLNHVEHETARQAFVRYRAPDTETTLRYRCEDRAPDCHRDRLPIPTLDLIDDPPPRSMR